MVLSREWGLDSLRGDVLRKKERLECFTHLLFNHLALWPPPKGASIDESILWTRQMQM